MKKTNTKRKDAASGDLGSWAKRYLEERGVSFANAVQEGSVRVVDAIEAQEQGFPSESGILFYTCDSNSETPIPAQIRYRIPRVVNGKTIKMQQKAGEQPPIFGIAEAMKTPPSTPIILSEGPTRYLAGKHRGFVVVAFTGVDCWGKNGTPNAELKHIDWRGRDVFIAYDSDATTNPRVKKAESKLGNALRQMGALVNVVRIPQRGRGFGMDDLLAAPGGADELRALMVAAKGSTSVTVTRLSDIQAAPVPWLVDSYLATGMITLLSGMPSAGKTYIALAIAASLTNGIEPFTRCSIVPCDVLYLSTENSAQYVTKPRFDALGGDPTRFFTSSDFVTLGEPEKLRSLLSATKPKLLILDPLQSFLGADVDSHRANATRPLLDTLIRLAEEFNVAVLIIRHTAKASGGRAIHAGLGSVDITGAARLEFLAGTEADQPNNRAMVAVKNNLGRFPDAMSYSIEGAGMAAKLVWNGKSSLTAADLLAPERKTNSQTGIQRMTAFLKSELADGKPHLIKELIEKSGMDGKMLQRAAKLIGVKRLRGGVRGAVMLQLREAGEEPNGQKS